MASLPDLAAQLVFQAVHGLGHGGLGAVQLQGGLAEAPCANGGQQNMDLIIVHYILQDK